jgi:hypothetical protein
MPTLGASKSEIEASGRVLQLVLGEEASNVRVPCAFNCAKES